MSQRCTKDQVSYYIIEGICLTLKLADVKLVVGDRVYLISCRHQQQVRMINGQTRCIQSLGRWQPIHRTGLIVTHAILTVCAGGGLGDTEDVAAQVLILISSTANVCSALAGHPAEICR